MTLLVGQEDWAAVQKSASEDHGEDEEAEEGGILHQNETCFACLYGRISIACGVL